MGEPAAALRKEVQSAQSDADSAAAVDAKENIGLVHVCARRFRGRGVEYDDLFQAGCLGLVKAADNFDPALGYRFSTYAVPVIIGEMKRLFRDGGSVKISRGLKELSVRVSREAEDFCVRNGREPTVGELAATLHEEPEKISEALNAARQPLSLTAFTEDGDAQTDIPVDAPDEKITELLSLRTELERLDERDRTLIRLRFYENKTQMQTAAVLGMTQVQVSRREKKILLCLREKLI